VRPAIAYPFFVLAFLAATYPIWTLWLLGFNPTLDNLLRITCLGSS
jgi:hypothetical protein